MDKSQKIGPGAGSGARLQEGLSGSTFRWLLACLGSPLTERSQAAGFGMGGLGILLAGVGFLLCLGTLIQA